MTPSEMLEKYIRYSHHKASFLGELDVFELFAFLEAPVDETRDGANATLGEWFDLHTYVVAELKRERNADWDTWNNLLALDKEIKQEWIDELTYLNTDLEQGFLWEILEYLKDRKHDG